MSKQKIPDLMRDVILDALDENKAEDVVTIDLAGKSAIADYMVIASGRSSRHVVGLSNHITEALAKAKLQKPKFDGKENGDWVLGDAGDVIIHLFRPEVREFYNIEKIWCDPEFLEKYEAQNSTAPQPEPMADA
jgi:ribosome-associated protein